MRTSSAAAIDRSTGTTAAAAALFAASAVAPSPKDSFHVEYGITQGLVEELVAGVMNAAISVDSLLPCAAVVLLVLLVLRLL